MHLSWIARRGAPSASHNLTLSQAGCCPPLAWGREPRGIFTIGCERGVYFPPEQARSSLSPPALRAAAKKKAFCFP